MASEDEKRLWEAKLKTAGFCVSGINLRDDDEVDEVLKTLGVRENEYAEKSRVRAFIQNKQQQQQQQPRDGTSTLGNGVLKILAEEHFYETAKLPRSLLEKSGLQDYINAAKAQVGSPYTKELLAYLLGLQINSDSDTDEDFVFEEYEKIDEPNLYVSIIASSGTGKTQLAATAALNYKEEATTVYLQFGNGNQRFYKPHMTQSANIFKKQISMFLNMLREGTEGKAVSASIIKTWAENRDDGASVFVRILYQLLFDEDSPEKCFLADLKKRREGKTLLVFLDEVPQKQQDDFDKVLCLRDTLRYLGIAPILMSTHTGAQDCVGESSRDSTSTWMHIISKLPPYRPSPDAEGKVILQSERPLVLGIASAWSKKGGTVPQIVKNIRRHLQKAKGNAWIKSPALQLVQLFCTDIEIQKEVFAVAHSLVGHHFGSLQQSDNGTTNFGAKSYSSSEARIFASKLSVAPVSARVEPLLYLALVTWDEDMLKTASKKREFFPLTNSSFEPITVREAYDLCSHDFTSKALCVNQQAQKANGDLLEVLVHASLTLASMKTSAEENKYLAGVPLKEYLPLVRRLMLPGKLDCIPGPPDIFDDLNVDWITIPALGGSDSGLPIELADVTNSLIGFLSRPKDKAMVDGHIFCMREENGKLETSDTPCISVECKNYSDGVDAAVLKDVFQRIDSNIKFCFVFISSVKGEIFKRTRLDSLKKECFKQHWESSLDSISVLRWDVDKEPTFLSVGKEVFRATEKTKLLVAIIEVGLVDEKKWDCRKRKRGYQACANLPWNVDDDS